MIICVPDSGMTVLPVPGNLVTLLGSYKLGP